MTTFVIAAWVTLLIGLALGAAACPSPRRLEARPRRFLARQGWVVVEPRDELHIVSDVDGEREQYERRAGL